MTNEERDILELLKGWERPFSAKPIIGPGGWVLRVDDARAVHGPDYRAAFERLLAVGCFEDFGDGHSYQVNDRGKQMIERM